LYKIYNRCFYSKLNQRVIIMKYGVSLFLYYVGDFIVLIIILNWVYYLTAKDIEVMNIYFYTDYSKYISLSLNQIWRILITFVISLNCSADNCNLIYSNPAVTCVMIFKNALKLTLPYKKESNLH
jgi:hypothetical protein